nr:S8 family peptidase [Brevibacillus sp. SYP-B805]
MISVPNKTYHHCVNCLTKDDGIKQKAKIFAALGILAVPADDYESFCKLIGNRKHKVSENVTVRLHADEIPWGVEYIGAPRYWNQTRGQGVKVAIIDTGISAKHPDLTGRVKGRVIIAGGGKAGKIGGHGTHVAGTIAAVANQKGIVGVAPDVELYDVQAFGADGNATVADVVAGINWAVEQKMDIINMSFGVSEDNYAMRQAVKRAARAGIVLVASAGNNGGALEYPAAYREVVAVGAVDKDNHLASFSARGRGLDMVAPGVGIKSTWPGNRYRILDGTSMAAAHVSGMYALSLAAKNRRIMRGIGKNSGEPRNQPAS